MPDTPLVSSAWLAKRLGAPDIVVVDGSWYLPGMNRDPDAEYLAGHIPGAVRFDIDTVKDTSSPLPHMLPRPEAFASAVRALRIGAGRRHALGRALPRRGPGAAGWPALGPYPGKPEPALERAHDEGAPEVARRDPRPRRPGRHRSQPPGHHHLRLGRVRGHPVARPRDDRQARQGALRRLMVRMGRPRRPPSRDGGGRPLAR